MTFATSGDASMPKYKQIIYLGALHVVLHSTWLVLAQILLKYYTVSDQSIHTRNLTGNFRCKCQEIKSLQHDLGLTQGFIPGGRA